MPSKRCKNQATKNPREIPYKMQFIDFVFAVLTKLREDKNPFICEKEIEDLYCLMILLGSGLHDIGDRSERRQTPTRIRG